MTFIVKCSNKSRKQKGSVSVWNADETLLLARVHADRSGLYKFICKNNCDERTELVRQLRLNGVTQGGIDNILSGERQKQKTLTDVLTFHPKMTDWEFGKEPSLLNLLKDYYIRSGIPSSQAMILVDQYLSQLESYSKQK